MREREEEIKNIHKGMHQVNEIYKVRHIILSRGVIPVRNMDPIHRDLFTSHFLLDYLFRI
jgi:hypothetical protein